MQIIPFRLEILSPIILTTLSGDENTVATDKYISGTSLLGALASSYIQEKNLQANAHTDIDFYDWFLSGKINFQNIYPKGKDENTDKYLYQPTPLFLQHDKKDEVNYDNVFTNGSLEKNYKSFEGLSIIKKDEREIHFASLKTKYNFHHERNYKTGISKEGKIFTYESLEKGYVFLGNFVGEEKDLSSFLSWLKSERILYIGRSKNSQYGKVKISINNETPSQDNAIEIEENFILSFTSDLILQNENGFPTTDIAKLMHYFNGCELVESESFSPSIVKTKPINGFHGAWKLRKNTDISIQAGSSFYLKISDLSQKEEILKKILSLQKSGIGARTQEGFGRFEIYTDSDSISILNKAEDIKPLLIYDIQNSKSTSISTELKELIQSVYESELKKLVFKEAQKDVDRFKGKINKASFVSSFLSFLNGDTGRFEYRSKSHNKEKSQFKELHRALERNVDRLSIDGKFLFDYFSEVKQTPDKLIGLGSDLEELRNDYPFLNNLSLEKDLNFTYFQTFVNLLRKKIKSEGGKK